MVRIALLMCKYCDLVALNESLLYMRSRPEHPIISTYILHIQFTIAREVADPAFCPN